MLDPKDRQFRLLARLRLIPRGPKNTSTTELLQRLKVEKFNIDRCTLQRDLIGRLALDFPPICDENQWPYQRSVPKDAPPFEFPVLDTPTVQAFVLAEPKHWVDVIKGTLINMGELHTPPTPHHSLTITNAHARQEAL